MRKLLILATSVAAIMCLAAPRLMAQAPSFSNVSADTIPEIEGKNLFVLATQKNLVARVNWYEYTVSYPEDGSFIQFIGVTDRIEVYPNGDVTIVSPTLAYDSSKRSTKEAKWRASRLLYTLNLRLQR
jgi:hypothetical protein